MGIVSVDAEEDAEVRDRVVGCERAEGIGRRLVERWDMFCRLEL